MARKSYRTAAQQDLILTSGFFASRLKCFGCGGEWRVARAKREEQANTHGAACRRVPNRRDVGTDVRSAIEAALGRM